MEMGIFYMCITNHVCSIFHSSGESFQLNLEAPSPNLKVEDFPDGNGETPSALGDYTRTLDICPENKLKFSAHIYSWYNQSEPSGDVLEGCSEQSDEEI